MRLHYQTRIPLIGKSIADSQLANPRSPLAHALKGTLTGSDYRNLVTDWNKRTDRFVRLKPGRRLGGSWIDRFVAQGKSVSLCLDECDRRYNDWQKRYGYKKRDVKSFTDCDGCGRKMQLCNAYFASIV